MCTSYGHRRDKQRLSELADDVLMMRAVGGHSPGGGPLTGLRNLPSDR